MLPMMTVMRTWRKLRHDNPPCVTMVMRMTLMLMLLMSMMHVDDAGGCVASKQRH